MVNALARKFGVQVTSDLTLASNWINLNGISDLDPEIAPNIEDAAAYDINGWGAKEVTLNEWSLQATFFRRYSTGNVYDPGQELIRAALGQSGTAARVGVRWFDKNGGPEAYSGVAIPAWKRTNTGVKNLEQAQVSMTGTDIPLNINIANPYTAGLVPVITSITPSGAAAAGAVAIYGANFTGTVVTTGVKFGGTNATSFTVQNDSLITAVLPAGSAGLITVLVTNATGPSTATNNYTRA